MLPRTSLSPLKHRSTPSRQKPTHPGEWPRGVDDLRPVAADVDAHAVGQAAVDGPLRHRRQAENLRLQGQRPVQGQVEVVQVSGGIAVGVQGLAGADRVDVGVGGDDAGRAHAPAASLQTMAGASSPGSTATATPRSVSPRSVQLKASV